MTVDQHGRPSLKKQPEMNVANAHEIILHNTYIAIRVTCISLSITKMFFKVVSSQCFSYSLYTQVDSFKIISEQNVLYFSHVLIATMASDPTPS